MTVRTTAFEPVIETVAFRKPRPSGVRTLPETVALDAVDAAMQVIVAIVVSPPLSRAVSVIV